MGERTSLRLAEAGAAVAVADLDRERVVRMANAIVAQGGAAIGIAAEETDQASVPAQASVVRWPD